MIRGRVHQQGYRLYLCCETPLSLHVVDISLFNTKQLAVDLHLRWGLAGLDVLHTAPSGCLVESTVKQGIVNRSTHMALGLEPKLWVPIASQGLSSVRPV